MRITLDVSNRHIAAQFPATELWQIYHLEVIPFTNFHNRFGSKLIESNLKMIKNVWLRIQPRTRSDFTRFTTSRYFIAGVPVVSRLPMGKQRALLICSLRSCAKTVARKWRGGTKIWLNSFHPFCCIPKTS